MIICTADVWKKIIKRRTRKNILQKIFSVNFECSIKIQTIVVFKCIWLFHFTRFGNLYTISYIGIFVLRAFIHFLYGWKTLPYKLSFTMVYRKGYHIYGFNRKFTIQRSYGRRISLNTTDFNSSIVIKK